MIAWDGDTQKPSGPRPMLGLRVQPIPFAGNDGTFSLGKDASSNVSVALTASDFIFWPFGWVCLCVVFATFAKNWLTEGRQITILWQRIDRAELAMQQAEDLSIRTCSPPKRSFPCTGPLRKKAPRSKLKWPL